MFHILIWVMVTWLYAHVKIHWAFHLYLCILLYVSQFFKKCLFICSNFGCSQFGVNINGTIMTILIPVFWWTFTLISLGHLSRSGMLDHSVYVCSSLPYIAVWLYSPDNRQKTMYSPYHHYVQHYIAIVTSEKN